MEVDWVSGSCWYFDREVYRLAGPMDQGYFLFFEDIDWCRQVQKRGLRNYYDPAISILHGHGKSAAEEPVLAAVAYRESQIRFVGKHYPPISLWALKRYLRWKYKRTLARAAGDAAQVEISERILQILDPPSS
jgi:N-acetylglucosaminyl-diphospho-decaprenol L-rhamnosyltransferase